MKKSILVLLMSLISIQVLANDCESPADASADVIRLAQSDLLGCSVGHGPQLSFLRIFEMKDPKPGCRNPERRVVLEVGSANRVTPNSPVVENAELETNNFFRFEMQDGSIVICSKYRWH